MKKIISTITVAAICLSSMLPTLAQKNQSSVAPLSISQSNKAFRSVSAWTDGNGSWLEWQTATENEILGFQVYRIAGDEKQLVSPVMIPANYLSSGDKITSGRNYNFFDPQGNLAVSYFIESVDARGVKQSSAVFAAQSVTDLSERAGVSSSELQKRSAESNPSVEKNELLLPAELQAERQANTFAPTDAASTQKWIAAQPAAKIGIKQDGLYRVTRAQLQSAGFDVNAPTQMWQLYADGIEQGIKIGTNGDYIEFYGRGLDVNESDTRVYYLVVGTQPGRRMGTTVHRGISAKIGAPNFQQVTVRKDHYTYIYQVLNGEDSNFYGSLITANNPGQVNIDLASVDFSVSTATFEISLQGFSEVAHDNKVLLNGTEIGMVSGVNLNLMQATFTIPTALLVEGLNIVKVQALNGILDNSFNESVKITYARRYEAVGDALSFYTPNYRTTRVQGFTTPDIRVFDLTDVTNPSQVLNLQIMPVGAGHEVVLPSYRSRVLYAVAGGGIKSPASVTANAPSTLSTVAHNAKLIIISYKDWMAQSETWANYRRADGLSVEVVNVEDIYDEFGYGVPTANSIRGFLEYAKTNWQTPPNYVLLMGDASYDPRNFLGVGNANFIPAKIVDTTFTETGSDESLADFNDDGLAEIAVGRIVARDAQMVTTLLNKTMTFEQSVAQAPSRGALCASDVEDGFDFLALCNRVFQTLPASITTTQLNRATHSRATLLDAINSGKYIVNYSGHGTFSAWAGSWFVRNDVATMTNTNNNQTIFVMLTCLNGYYVDAYSDGLSETLVKKANGGAVASWTSSGKTTPDVQETMAARFYQQIGNNPSMNRMGDLVSDAKTTIEAGRDVRLSWVLLGDPTMKVK